MKNWIKVFPLILALLFAFQIDADAQYYGKKKKKKKKPAKTEQVEKRSESTIPSRSKSSQTVKFTDKLWYGAGFNLNFSGANGFNVFNLGLSPMVGYKIIEPLSVGPRVGINYSYIKANINGRVLKVQPVSFEYGVFARYKIVPIIFAHVEYTRQNEETFSDVDIQTGSPITERNQTNDVNIGLGYNSGGELSYEIMLLYDAVDDDERFPGDTALPFSVRVGFNYRF